MRRSPPLILAGLAALGIAACGGTTTTTTPPSTTTVTHTQALKTSTTTKTVTTADPTSTTAVTGPRRATQCRGNVVVPTNASCDFGNNVFYWVWHARNDGGWNEQGPLKLLVWSPATTQDYPVTCALQSGEVNCTGARFSLSSVQAYTKQEALAYEQSGKLGPGTAQSGQNP